MVGELFMSWMSHGFQGDPLSVGGGGGDGSGKKVGVDNLSGNDTAWDAVAGAGFMAFFVAALVEELLKYFVALWGLSRAQNCAAAVVYSLAGALGFASLENCLYIMSSGLGIAGFGTALARSVVSVPLHASTGIIIGVCLGRRKFKGVHMPAWKVLRFPILVHGMFDFALMSASAWAGVAGTKEVCTVCP
jgi:RsiW-degrading membrane proteinase PrsW (M82 family)